MLDAIYQHGYWPDNYVHRRCTNYEQLADCAIEFEGYCDYGSVLYVACHGHEGTLWFDERLEVCVEQFALMFQESCGKCIVHFSSCWTLKQDPRVFHSFLDTTHAVAVSGYDREVGWHSRTASALAADEKYLIGLNSTDGNRPPNLRRWGSQDIQRYQHLCGDVARQYEDCGFRSYQAAAKL